MSSRWIVPGLLFLTMARALALPRAVAQAPTIHTGSTLQPGSTASTLGPTPGAGGSPFGFLPGAGEMILGGGRPGPGFPRVPTSISTPGQGTARAARPLGIVVPNPLPKASLAIYGTLALPKGAEDEGPPEGLTLDQAIDRLVHASLNLQAKSFEIPQARADILTAGLRANPILYADGQLVPYGKYARERPGGPTQYDVNISHPFDLSRKRQARTDAAERTLSVLEAQYLNAVRMEINNLYTAYVDFLAARETLRLAQASVSGLARVLEVTETLYKRADVVRPDVVRVRLQKQFAEIGVEEARAILLRARRSLAVLLTMPPGEAEGLELRGTIANPAPLPAAPEDLVELALQVRPDLIAQRLGVGRAEADFRLARAERFSDVYVLYQPYTFQNNAPYGTQSATSWTLGVTAAVPIHNRNQGVIQRAYLNITQTEVEVAALERQIGTEVTQAARECALTGDVVRRLQTEVLPAAERMRDDAFRLFTTGESDFLAYSNVQRDYNLVVRRYRDALVRHRRSMLGLNTAVGQRIVP